MPLTNTQYDIILRDYENRQLKNRHEAEQRAAYVYDHVPGYRELDESVAAVSVSQGKKYLAGDEQAMEELKLLISELSFKKARLLKEAGLPEDYLKPVHTCPDCRDTGYIDGQKCHCFKQAMISLLYEQSNILRIL